ncbi:MAG: hypothetical protein ACFFDF_06135 [Candidatus Odinarchaeota archaeon]
MLEKLFRKRINEIHDKYADKNILLIDDFSNFFGLESSGVWKIRGNGVLLLTQKELFFGMWKPKKELLIPIDQIMEITNPKSHMNRSVFKPLLKVVFANQYGDNDSAAWYVRNLDKWNVILNKLLSKK